MLVLIRSKACCCVHAFYVVVANVTSSSFTVVCGCRSHLEATYDSVETQEDLALLRQQADIDLAAGMNVPGIPEPGSEHGAVIAGAMANCEAQMQANRKTTALKSLQVRPDGGWPQIRLRPCMHEMKQLCTH